MFEFRKRLKRNLEPTFIVRKQLVKVPRDAKLTFRLVGLNSAVQCFGEPQYFEYLDGMYFNFN